MEEFVLLGVEGEIGVFVTVLFELRVIFGVYVVSLFYLLMVRFSGSVNLLFVLSDRTSVTFY